MMLLPPLLLFIMDTIAMIAIYLIATLSLNIQYGYTGIADFGKSAGVAVGAYVVGAIPGRVLMALLAIEGDYIKDNTPIVSAINSVLSVDIALAIGTLMLGLALAAGLGALFGYVASYPVARLKGEYLAIFMLAISEAMRYIFNYYTPVVGGPYGVTVPDPFKFITSAYGGQLRLIFASVVILIISIGMFYYAERLARSPLGRTLRAIRDCDVAAEVLGKDVASYRMKIMVLSSAMAAIAGALYAFYTLYVAAIAYDRVTWTFWPWTILILGGMANNVGVVIGTILFVVVTRLIIIFKRSLEPILPFDVIWLEYILFGLMLILVLMFRPEGILPEKPTKTIEFEKIKERRARKGRSHGKASS